MKMDLIQLLAITILGIARTSNGAETNAWGAVTNAFQISVSTKGGVKHFEIKQAVMLLVRLRNLSTNETFHFYRANAGERSPAFSFVVTTPSGKDISPPTPYAFHGSGHFIDVDPGQTKEMEVNLNRLCEFDEAGKYCIIVRHWPSRWRDKGNSPPVLFEAISNPLYVSIGP